MKKVFFLLLFVLAGILYVKAQDSTLFDPIYKPFYHGVASGDPLEDRVIIWTRVTPDTLGSMISGTWQVSTDTGMTQTVQTGIFMTGPSEDYTVKIDVAGLQSGETYYYMFNALGRNSLIGRTHTAPGAGGSDHLKFVFVSCASYEAGYFNAFGRIADRNDLDAVIHLGDYFYEYESGRYADSTLVDAGLRVVDSVEAINLEQYRTRYSLYRLDTDLRRVHQQHPFICVWDDHESANNSYPDGAENHDPVTEGPWEDRKSDSKKAFFEWIPIREQPQDIIYRSFSYGGLADLFMLDTRLEGRDKQIEILPDSALFDSNRSLLGATQRAWFKNELQQSQATWKLIGNQVLFSELHVGWISLFDSTRTFDEVESEFLDSWDGYPAERDGIENLIESDSIDNVVFLTGDMHTALAYDVADSVVDPLNNYVPLPYYDPLTGEGSIAVEFVTPSISAWNFNEEFGETASFFIEAQLNGGIFGVGNNPNPHMKYADLDRHGYVLVDITEDSVQGNWFYVDRLDIPSLVEYWDTAWYTRSGENHLRSGAAESPPKASQEIPAPALPPNPGTGIDPSGVNDPMTLIVYPNPAKYEAVVAFELSIPQQVRIQLTDMTGKALATIADNHLVSGKHQYVFTTDYLNPGVYLVSFQAGSRIQFRKLVVVR